jgi:putative transcriptional regulator
MKSKLSEFMEFYNITQKELSDATGINRNTIGRYANGSFESINKEHLDLLCSFFKCSLDKLFVVDATIPISYPSIVVQESIWNIPFPESLNIITEVDEGSSKPHRNGLIFHTFGTGKTQNMITHLSKYANIQKDNSVNLEQQSLETVKQFEEINNTTSIKTVEDEEIEQIQERLDLEYTLEENLELIINNIISKSDLSSLPIRISREIEAYSQQNATSFQFKFILAYRSLYALIVKQVHSRKLIDFISRIIKIYNNGGLYEISNDDLENLIIESNNLLNTYQKD